MEFTFRGTRGSVPAPGPGTVRYGGNTTAIEVRSATDSMLIVDGGSGIREAGKTGKPLPSEFAILVTHMHWDAIQGLPFFDCMYDPSRTITLYGPRPLPDLSLREALEIQMRPPHFPITMERIEARLEIVELEPEQVFEAGDLRVRVHLMNHPGGRTFGYRIEDAGSGEAAVIAPDNELPKMVGDELRRMADFVRGADVLVHDAQYVGDEYPGKINWGHSTMESVLELAHEADLRSLIFTHHDPARTDELLEAAVTRVIAEDQLHRPRSDLDAFAAEEGSRIAVAELEARQRASR